MSNPGLIPSMKPPTVAGLYLLRLRWRVVMMFSLAGLATAIIYYLWMPKIYDAELLIAPKRNPSEMIPGRNLLSSLSGADPSGGSLFGQSESDRIAAVLQSRSVTDEVIAKFDLVNRYHAGNI